MPTQRTVVSKGFFTKLYDAVMDNGRQVGLIAGLIVGFMGLAFVYMLWVNEKNKSAQRDFGLLIMEYDQALQGQDADWQKLLEKFESGYAKHSGASLLPYYKDYAVNILLKQNKTEEALVVLDSIIADTQASPLLSLYQMKKALLLLDMTDTEKQKQREDVLIALSKDALNQFHDAALFYLGRYYWAKNEITSAREFWQQLVDEQRDEKVAPSPWAQQVKDYLKLVIV